MIKKYLDWLNESKNPPYFNKADIIGDEEDASINEVFDFLGVKDKVICIDPDSEDKSDYNLLQIIINKLINYKSFRSIKGDFTFDEYICYENFENCGKIVKCYHSNEQFIMIMMNETTYSKLHKKFMGTLTGKKYGL